MVDLKTGSDVSSIINPAIKPIAAAVEKTKICFFTKKTTHTKPKKRFLKNGCDELKKTVDGIAYHHKKLS